MQKVPVEISIKFDLPCDEQDTMFKLSPSDTVRRLVFDDITNFITQNHLLLALESEAKNNLHLAEHHKFWAKMMKLATIEVKTPTLSESDPLELRRVVGVAIQSSFNGKLYSLPAPARHHDVIRHMIHDHGLPKPAKGTQGFVLDDGRFVDRVEAKKLATANGQLLARASKGDELYSECVW